MTQQTTFGFTPTWWAERNRFSTKMGGRAHVVCCALALVPLAVALWAYNNNDDRRR